MGKVFKNELLGSAGAISHSADEIVISLANKDNRDLPFGFPVFLNEDGSGVVGISTASNPAKFVGFAVRVPDKTPPVYDDPDGIGANNNAVYKKGDLVDILVRGSMVVDAMGTIAKPGMPVYLNKVYGKVTAESSDNTLTVPGLYFRTVRDIGGRTEILVSERHAQ